VAKGKATYAPIARFLTKTTGAHFVYVHPDSWLTYERWIWANRGDLYFDGPHFAAWRMHKQGATLGPVLPQPQDWRMFTWHNNAAIGKFADTYGKKFCAPPAPNFGALWAGAQYTNPARQPLWVDTHNWVRIYHRVLSHRCELGVAPKTTLDKLDPDRTHVSIVLKGPHFPNQAFTLSKAVPAKLRRRVIKALLSPAGQTAMNALRTRYTNGRTLVAGEPKRYAHVDESLAKHWGPIYRRVIAKMRREHKTEQTATSNAGAQPTANARLQGAVSVE